MSAQAGLFDPAPAPAPAPVAPPAERLARVTDNDASREAALSGVRSGRIATNMAVVEAVVTAHPWATSLELLGLEGKLLARRGVDRVELSRRLSSLREAGRVVRMDRDANPTLRPCGCSYLHSRLYRWAVPADIPLAAGFVAAGETPIIDRGSRQAADAAGDRAA